MKLLFLFFTYALADEVTVEPGEVTVEPDEVTVEPDEVTVEPDEVAVELTAADFADYVKDRNVLVQFYVTWSEHCKILKPKMEAAAVKVNLNDSIDATIAKIDSDADEEGLAKRYGVRGYPSIKWFPKGSLRGEEYNGERETKDIIEFVKEASIPDVFTITKKQSEEFGKDSDYCVISTVKVDSKKEIQFDRACTRLKKEMKKMGKSFKCGKTRLKKGKTKVFFRRNRFEESDGPVQLKYDGKMAKLDGWVLDNVFGQFGLFDTGFLLDRFDQELFLIVLEDKKYPFEIEGLSDFVNKMKQETGIQANMLDQQAAVNWGFPADKDVIYAYAKIIESSAKNDKLRPQDYDRYILDPAVNNTDLDIFLSKARASDWEVYMKSQSPDDVQQDGLVVPLIGTTFQDVVYDTTKDVLVNFYAPAGYCEGCEKFAPEYEKLAQTIEKHYKKKNVLFTKIDIISNDIPYEIMEFPTLYMFPEGKDAKPIMYEGNRDMEDLIDFVDEYSQSVKSDKKDEL